MKVEQFYKFIVSEIKENAIVSVKAIESVQLSEHSKYYLDYVPCILFTLKSGNIISWEYNIANDQCFDFVKMETEFARIKSEIQKVIISDTKKASRN